jgi:hypothetical protein
MTVDSNTKIIKDIAKIIVDNRDELIKKLDELGISCSCSLHDATEKSLSDIIVDNIENKELILWLAEKIASNESEYKNAGADPITAIANAITAIEENIGKGLSLVLAGQKKRTVKEQYKRDLTLEVIKIKEERERAMRNEKTRDTLIIAGVSFFILGVSALIYFKSTKGQPKLAQ